MSVGLNVWSQTAATNSTADTNINWPEGMAPSQINDSARALMASMAKWRDDNNGTIVTAGTTVAFTATTSQVEAALTAGYTIAIQFNATADTSATLAVDSLAAKPMQIVAGTNLQGGEFTAGDICRFTYSSTGTGQWIANGSPGYIQNSNQLADTIVTYQKLQTPGASKLLGNPSTSTSTGYREISLGTNLSFSGAVLNAGNNTPVITTITSTATTTWQSTTQGGNFPLYLLVRMAAGGGGGGASSTNNGSTGIDTSFSNWTAIGGGKGLTAGGGGTGGTGGTNGTGTLIRRISGGTGGVGNGSIGYGGPGGINPLGGLAQITAGSSGLDGVANTGAGASGAQNSGAGGQSAGGGGAGEYVEFIITSPSTSYSLQVGPGGAGGAAGVRPGGTGATGRIEVVAYWQ